MEPQLGADPPLAFVPGRGIGIFFVMGQLDIGTFSDMASAVNGTLAMLAPR